MHSRSGEHSSAHTESSRLRGLILGLSLRRSSSISLMPCPARMLASSSPSCPLCRFFCWERCTQNKELLKQPERCREKHMEHAQQCQTRMAAWTFSHFLAHCSAVCPTSCEISLYSSAQRKTTMDVIKRATEDGQTLNCTAQLTTMCGETVARSLNQLLFVLRLGSHREEFGHLLISPNNAIGL